MKVIKKIVVIIFISVSVLCLSSCNFIFATHPFLVRDDYYNEKYFKVYQLLINSSTSSEIDLIRIIFEMNEDNDKVFLAYKVNRDDKLYFYYIYQSSDATLTYGFSKNAFLITDEPLSETELEEFKIANNWYVKENADEICLYDDLYSVKDKNIDNITDLPIIVAEKMQQLGYSDITQDWYFGEYTYCYPNKILYAIKESEDAESYKYLILIEFLGNGVIDIQADKVFDIKIHSLKELSTFINENAIACWQGYTVGEDEIKSLVLD